MGGAVGGAVGEGGGAGSLGEPRVCIECGSEFPTAAQLDAHKRREHPPIQSYRPRGVGGGAGGGVLAAPREDSTSEEEDDFPLR